MQKLPVDPFAENAGKLPDHLQHFERSLDGRGYLYRQKPDGQTIKSYEPLEFEHAPGAWYIKSEGLQKFQFRYPRSNLGLIRSRGYWGRLQFDISMTHG